MPIIFKAAITALFLTLGWQQTIAHPHVWITAKVDLLFDKQNYFVAIRHAWQFDEAFAAYATQGLDKNKDGRYSRNELAKLATINVESLADFNYFTFTKMGRINPLYSPSKEYWLEYEDGVLTLFYTIPLERPLQPDPTNGFEDLVIDVFDPAYFATVELAADNPVGTYGPNDTETVCRAKFVRPQELDAEYSERLAAIGPNEDIPADLSPEVSYLANTITVDCQPSS